MAKISDFLHGIIVSFRCVLPDSEKSAKKKNKTSSSPAASHTKVVPDVVPASVTDPSASRTMQDGSSSDSNHQHIRSEYHPSLAPLHRKFSSRILQNNY
ncbi:hypothetical protein BVRB_1g017970 [Beta vulgaris subsp. vulgaris]|nr:hypothetical protein BVRB_1g017970 [Beta vulgaris subsp. vulgaris]